MKRSRIGTALLLLALTLLFASCAACITSCEKDAGSTPAAPKNGGESVEEETTAYDGPLPDLPDTVFPEGTEILFLTSENNWFDIDVQNSESNGDVLQDAIVKRNIEIADTYNVTIKQEQISIPSLPSRIQNLSAAGDMPYHAIVTGFDSTWPLAQQELLCDLNEDLPYINLNQPWWDQGIRRDVSIQNRLFCCANSMTLSTDNVTWIAMFNKKMLSDVGLSDSDLYGYVKDGTWTLDKYNEITRGFVKDLNNDGYMNCADQYGTAYQGSGPDGFLISGGLRYITKDENDELIFADLDDRTLDVINKVYAICKGGTAFNSHYAGTNDLMATETEYGRTLFLENRALFFTESLGSSQVFRDMEADFGIVPLPKYDEKTEVYTSFIHNGGCGLVSVPILCSDPEMTGFILEAMAFLSYRDVSPVYFGKTIEGKIVRDTESMEMVKYIVQNRVVEQGFSIVNLTLPGLIRNAINDGTPAFASMYARSGRLAMAAVREINDQFE